MRGMKSEDGEDGAMRKGVRMSENWRGVRKERN